jgi:hypothetical protein
MTWADFYLICFLVGLVLSIVSLALGAFTAGGAEVAGDLPVDAPGHAGAPAHGGGLHVSPFNFSTVMAFLAWFGGTGYLLTRFSGVWSLLALGIAFVGGVSGSALVFWFLVKVLVVHDHTMRPDDYRVEGALATVVSAIGEGRIGEVVFSQGGTRHTTGARSEDGRALAPGHEVVITRYEQGIAHVRRLDELTGDESRAAAGESTG